MRRNDVHPFAIGNQIMKLRWLGLGAALVALATTPAVAHHSFGMFAIEKVIPVTGTVKDYKYRMPHVWIYLMVPSANGGAPEEWGFEAHSPNLVARKGWKPSTLKPGDKITILMHPMRDGSHAGSVINMTLPDGKVLWNADSISAP
jgi:hypothetical protein